MSKTPDVQGEMYIKSGDKATEDEIINLWLNLTEERRDIILKFLEMVSQNRKQADIVCNMLLNGQIEEGIKLILEY